ncbi:MAG: hypothetical protein JSV20_07370 [Candidatus Bathyarchaeota archaeon]|nr:MAG: hypothetical protein JSV20_07370 [Candidatus Bathyarchaeota archaeon]
MSYHHIIEELAQRIGSLKGVHDVMVMEDDDKKKLSELETLAGQRVLMGLGKGDNQGVTTVLKRDIVLAFITDNEYVWPPGPNLVLVCQDTMIGCEITDPEELEELKNKDNVILMGNFALFKDKIPKPSLMTREPIKAVFPCKPCHEVATIPEVSDAVLGFPSPPSCDYIKTIMKADLNDRQLGAVLLGFNIQNGG